MFLTITSRGGGRVLFILASLGALIAAAALAPFALAANHSYPATYSGSAASGGTVEFDTSADGANVTRFVIKEVPTSCGTVSGTSTGAYPIVNGTFSYGSSVSVIRFSGSFPATQQAQGTLSVHNGFPSCTSKDVNWSASTSTPPPVPPDSTPPQTKIGSGPKAKTKSHQATLRFNSDEPGSSFQCKLDHRSWQTCRSPKTYRHLKVGGHTFRVRAQDSAGNVDPTPASRTWRVKSE